MAANYWAKIWIDMLDDRKVGNLPDSQKWRWVSVILMAKEYNQDGILPTVEDMAWRLRPMTTEQLTNDLTHLARAGLVELVLTDTGERWFISKFADRQRASTSTERSQLRRSAQDSQRYDGDDATQVQRIVAQKQKQIAETEAETETEAEADKKAAAAAAAVNPRLQALGLGTNARTLALLDLPHFNDDYAADMVAWAERTGRDLGLAIKKIEDGDPVPGERKRTIPADIEAVIVR